MARFFLPAKAVAGFSVQVGVFAPFSETNGSGEIKFRVLPEDLEAAKKPRVAMNPGRYNLGEEIRFVVTRRPIGERIVNESQIVWYSAGKDNVSTKVPLPDGYDTWAAVSFPGSTVLWIGQKDLLRIYDFTKPEAIRESCIEGDYSLSPHITSDIRETMSAALSNANVPDELRKVKPSAAANGGPRVKRNESGR